MQISPINLFNYKSKNENISHRDFLPKLNNLKSDIISFTARRSSVPVEQRLTDYAVNLLKDSGLKKGQPVYIKGDSYYLPFMEILSKEAYKLHSGIVEMDVMEESLEALKRRHNKTQTLDYTKLRIDDLKKDGALFFEFNQDNDPYKKAKVMKIEAKELYLKSYTKLPPSITKLFKVNPKEIFIDALDLHKGQPVQIIAEREHIPIVKKLMQYLYSKNKTDVVDTYIPNANRRNKLLYADEEVLDKLPNYYLSEAKEHLDKDIAQLTLYSPAPSDGEVIPQERISRYSKALNSSEEYNIANAQMSQDLPWSVYYVPTTKSSVSAYPEFADDKLKLIAKAYQDASKINRVGHLKEHIANLEYRADKLNKLLEDGYRTFHYVSIDPKTQKPDGITDFKVTMSPKSVFKTALFDKPKFNHITIANVPSEEVFTAPLSDSAQGKIRSTKSLSLNGHLLKDIEFEFLDGKVVSSKASENEDVLKEHISTNENADRLGEVAIVADSPIEKMNRLFNNILLDENASSHLALGNAYPDSVKGASEIDSYDKLQKYLKDEKINQSTAHTDFMVGGKNVVITAINDETGDCIEIVRNDKFLL